MEKRPLAARLARWIVDHPKTLWALLVLLLLGSVLTLPALRVETGYDPFFSPGMKQREIMRMVDKRFVSEEMIVIGYRTDDPFSARRLVELRALGAAFEALVVEHGRQTKRAIREVISLATIKDLLGSELSFRTVPLLPQPVPNESSALREIARRARDNPLIRDSLLGADHQVASVLLRLDEGLSDGQKAEAVRRVRGLLAGAESVTPQTRYVVGGQPVVEADHARYQNDDLARFVPIVYGLLSLLIYAFVRRKKSVALILTAVTLSLLGATAVLVLVGSSINNCSSMLPPVMVALTVAINLHFYSELGKYGGATPREVAWRTLARLLPPSLVAAITTAIGFAALAISEVPAVRDFGLAAAAGMLISLMVTVSVFALAARRLPREALMAPRVAGASPRLGTALGGVASFVLRRSGLVLAMGLLALLAVGFGIARVEVDMRLIEFFDRQAPVRKAEAFVDRHLAGSTVFVVAIDGGRSGHFVDPAHLRRVEALEKFMARELGLEAVTSPVGYLKLMHRAFFAGEAKAYRLPETKQQAAQLLLLNGDERLEQFLDGERRHVRVVGRGTMPSAVRVAESYRRLDAYLARHFPADAGYRAHATGRSRLSAELMSSLIDSQVQSIALSALLIFLLLLALFRSLSAGLVAVLPNALPVATGLGLMGWLGIPLDASTVMIATVALGIAVDDTVHFLQHYRRELAVGGDAGQALREALQVKGPAIVWTSVVISAGFSVLVSSNFLATRHFGLLVCTAMLVALLGDLLLLPALLLRVRRGGATAARLSGVREVVRRRAAA